MLVKRFTRQASTGIRQGGMKVGPSTAARTVAANMPCSGQGRRKRVQGDIPMKTMQGASCVASWNSCRSLASDSPAHSNHINDKACTAQAPSA